MIVTMFSFLTKTLILLYSIHFACSATLIRTKLPRNFASPIGAQILLNPSNGPKNQLLSGTIVKVYEDISEAQRDFGVINQLPPIRRLRRIRRLPGNRRRRFRGQRFFGGLAGLLGAAQTILPLAQTGIGVLQSAQAGDGLGAAQGVLSLAQQALPLLGGK